MTDQKNNPQRLSQGAALWDQIFSRHPTPPISSGDAPNTPPAPSAIPDSTIAPLHLRAFALSLARNSQLLDSTNALLNEVKTLVTTLSGTLSTEATRSTDLLVIGHKLSTFLSAPEGGIGIISDLIGKQQETQVELRQVLEEQRRLGGVLERLLGQLGMHGGGITAQVSTDAMEERRVWDIVPASREELSLDSASPSTRVAETQTDTWPRSLSSVTAQLPSNKRTCNDTQSEDKAQELKALGRRVSGETEVERNIFGSHSEEIPNRQKAKGELVGMAGGLKGSSGQELVSSPPAAQKRRRLLESDDEDDLWAGMD